MDTTSPGTRPNCSCHGEPQLKDGHGGWTCAVNRRAVRRAHREAHLDEYLAREKAYRAAHREQTQARWRRYYEANREAIIARATERYWAMSGVERNRELLRIRRSKALKRMAQREARHG